MLTLSGKALTAVTYLWHSNLPLNSQNVCRESGPKEYVEVKIQQPSPKNSVSEEQREGICTLGVNLLTVAGPGDVVLAMQDCIKASFSLLFCL